MRRILRENRLFLLLATTVLFASFAFNIFGAQKTLGFDLNFKSSENLIENRIICDGDLHSGQLLRQKGGYKAKEKVDSCDPEQLEAYVSQYGIQGPVYTELSNAVVSIFGISYESSIGVLNLITAFGSALTFSALALWFRKNYGNGSAYAVVLLSSMSPMLVGFGKNLYWALALMLLPLALTLWAYKPKMARKYAIIFWLSLGALLYLRYLAGYEYLTTLTIMVMAAMTVALYSSKSSLKTYLMQFFIAGAVSVAAFLLALGTHINQLNYETGSTRASIEIIKERAEERTTESSTFLKLPYNNLKNTTPEIYIAIDEYIDLDIARESGSELSANTVAALNYALLPMAKLPFQLREPIATYLQSGLSLIAIAGLLYRFRKRWVASKDRRSMEALFYGAGLGLVGVASWLILARSHSLVHAHINGILFYLPFGIFGFAILGAYLERMLLRIFSKK